MTTTTIYFIAVEMTILKSTTVTTGALERIEIGSRFSVSCAEGLSTIEIARTSTGYRQTSQVDCFRIADSRRTVRTRNYFEVGILPVDSTKSSKNLNSRPVVNPCAVTTSVPKSEIAVPNALAVS
jgi:hypothetical protein